MNNIFNFLYLSTVFFSIMLSGCQYQKENWTQFRGSQLDGIATVNNAPVKWTADSNITWKTEIHGRGWSSPVVFGDQIWVTTATEDGYELSAVCVDYNTGKIIHDIKVFEPDTVYGKHAINSYATPTPCIENEFVYVHFGTYGTACIKTKDGSIVWKRTDLSCNHIQGPGSSPVLYKNLLILHIEGIDVQYIIALDKTNGQTVWKAERRQELYEPLEPIGRKAYITPLIVNVKGRDLLISNGSAVCSAYDPETGKEIWWIVWGEDSTIAMPVSEDGTVYFYTSFVVPSEGENYAELMAVNPDGEGDIAENNILWRMKAPVLQLSTPVIRDGLIYTIDSENNLMCIDAKTGEIIYSDKLKSKHNSSPIYAHGNIYFCSTRGETIIIKEGRRYEKVAVNKLDGEIWSTPAILRNSILIRTSKYLYRLGSLA
jgi:outer membrane protein assembly factor BamB